MMKAFCMLLLTALPLCAQVNEGFTFRAPAREVAETADGFLWFETEEFADYGAWKLDTQFIHTMGSAYLIACGVGKPIADASTPFKLAKGGTFTVWVRDKDWMPKFSPGAFTLLFDGKAIAKTLGVSKLDGWRWENAGTAELKAGRHSLALRDLSGAFARCDAVLLSRDAGYVPPQGDCAKERVRLAGLDSETKDKGAFDVIVVGAGTTGCSAAVAAARNGAKTALVHDRPVLGGNSSIELGVSIQGASCLHKNARESGLIEEAGLIRVGKKFRSISDAFQAQAADEKNLTVFSNERVTAVEMKDPANISAVLSFNTLSHSRSRYRAKFFIDCTGDGWVGFYAGARSRFGREARSEFNENAAPEKADDITMSGCIMGGYACAFRSVDTGKPVSYALPAWAAGAVPSYDAIHRNPSRLNSGEWWMEHPGTVNDLTDPEGARDELIRITFAYWDFVKNGWKDKAKAANYELAFVPYMDARRETRRLVGDYIFTENDAERGEMFPDRISYGGWSIDVHNPQGMLSGKSGPYYFDGHTPIYSIPYRTLYSTNIVNLLFAGRHQSVTHMGLGSVRVEGTLATCGQAAGTAAALCLKNKTTPRELGQRYIVDLQQQLLKDDQYIPGLTNTDPADLARPAAVSASSTRTADTYSRRDARTKDSHPLNHSRAVLFDRGLNPRLKQIHLCLISSNAAPTQLTLHARLAKSPNDFSATDDFCTATASAPAMKRAYVDFTIDRDLPARYVWCFLPPTPGIEWVLLDSAKNGCRAYSGNAGKTWTVVEGQQYAFYTTPDLAFPAAYAPENVIDGVTRPVGQTAHLWCSDPAAKLPQWIALDFGKPVTVHELRVTFDTNQNDREVTPHALFSCAKDYTLELYDGKAWHSVATVKDNFLRLRVHDFEPQTATKARLTVTATHGDPSARVFEIRAY